MYEALKRPPFCLLHDLRIDDFAWKITHSLSRRRDGHFHLCSLHHDSMLPRPDSLIFSLEVSQVTLARGEGASLEQPAPEKPALELKLDDAGIQVMESPPPAVDGYPRRIQIIDEPMDPRVKRARIGFLVSTGVALRWFCAHHGRAGRPLSPEERSSGATLLTGPSRLLLPVALSSALVLSG